MTSEQFRNPAPHSFWGYFFFSFSRKIYFPFSSLLSLFSAVAFTPLGRGNFFFSTNFMSMISARWSPQRRSSTRNPRDHEYRYTYTTLRGPAQISFTDFLLQWRHQIKIARKSFGPSCTCFIHTHTSSGRMTPGAAVHGTPKSYKTWIGWIIMDNG